MDTQTTPEERKFGLTPKERTSWEENGYFVHYDVFTKEENDLAKAEWTRPEAVNKKRPPMWIRVKPIPVWQMKFNGTLYQFWKIRS